MAAERIDVLAVMDRSIEILHGNAWGEDRDDLQQARAAVAELIEADKEYDAACGRIYDQPSGYEPSAEEWDRFYVAEHRRAAALARMGEGS